MSCRIRLVLALHDHQPIGNFDGVFEAAYQDSYKSLLDVLEQYPEIPLSLHTSGSLLEWIAERHPEYIDRLRMLADRGQIEIIGGAFYEPILATIPRRDRVGQISAFTRYLEKLLGVNVRGMWIPERVWEQSFAGDVTQAGIEYTILDDFHFRSAGLREDELYGYYLSEDEGRLLKIFPGSEKLRYTIPFADPQESIDYLRQIADRYPNSVVTFGDDGEKFGTWPGTKKHVYQDGWIHRFFDALRANSDWIKISTLSEVVDNVSPIGKIYLPDASYREMTEWALPVSRQIEYQQIVHDRQNTDSGWKQLSQFMRGGFWRNFRVKYPESNEMYARLLQVSERLQNLAAGEAARENPDLLSQARTELYRGECNCPYWHGAFGGLYLPHLRNSVYHHLIAADSLLEQAAGRDGHWVEIAADDYNVDARKEVRLASDRLVAFLSPARGGHIYELDIRSINHNLLATLNRRPEVYHEKVRQAGERQGRQDDNRAVSIHDLVAFKQPDLHKKLQYDAWPRKSCVDHFFQPGLNLARFQLGEGEIGDFATAAYETVLRRSPEQVQARLGRHANLGPYAVTLNKTIGLERGSGQLDILYELEALPQNVPIHFGIEFNFAGMAAGAPDRYFYDSNGRQLGQLETIQDLTNSDRIGLVDEWLGLDASLEFSQAAGIWTFPIQTISQSEGGFEAVHQSTAVVPHWEFTAARDGKWSVRITLSLDTSAAQARRLREAAAVS
ncbi:MAG TPA: alpha-amylase/4-alpha-glucanotransferase domain-containing protein [Planctomycetaceae bacterium]|nr:alpha-amylase/4-alpha-glucanotransferase domain-containing protein [Planctomycetaceae bacterium]